jgi:hypothetical protein
MVHLLKFCLYPSYIDDLFSIDGSNASGKGLLTPGAPYCSPLGRALRCVSNLLGPRSAPAKTNRHRSRLSLPRFRTIRGAGVRQLWRSF